MNFKQWVESHYPELDWHWNNAQELEEQFIDVVATSGYIDLKTVFREFFSNSDSGLTVEQNEQWLK